MPQVNRLYTWYSPRSISIRGALASGDAYDIHPITRSSESSDLAPVTTVTTAYSMVNVCSSTGTIVKVSRM